MAFNPANITVAIAPSAIGGAVAFYTTDDTISATRASGYFSDALPGLRLGDAILVAASDATWLAQVVIADTVGPDISIQTLIHIS